MKSILVTGATTGIGHATTAHFSARGCRVFAGFRRPADGERLEAEGGGRVVPLLLDVTESGQIDLAVKRIRTIVGGDGLCGIVNNAGIAIGGPLEALPVAELRRQLEVNTIGPVALTQAVLPLLRDGRGRVVNISSDSGYLAVPLMGAYCASKFAIEAISDALRLELRRSHIHVAVVQPGPVDTPIWDRVLGEADQMLNGYSDDMRNLYGHLAARSRAAFEKERRRAQPVAAVVRAIEHALLSRAPRTRYLVGTDAKLRWYAKKILPDRWLDRLIAHDMGI